MTTHANGPFDVKMQVLTLSEVAANTGLGHMSLDKQYHGDLDAASQGEMLSFRSTVPGSAGYVAMETVRGALHGRNGSFVLQHSSSLVRGAPVQSITVVPDSGTEDLTGIAGSMVIDIVEGKHSYRFDYTLGDSV